MSRSTPRAVLSLLAVAAGGVVLAGCERAETSTGPAAATGDAAAEAHHQSVTTDPGTLGQLAEVRDATAPYQDLSAAVADGYTQFSIHVPNMGFHYLHDSAFDADGNSTLDRSLDRSSPEVLVYVDDAAPATNSDQRRLVAAEYAVPKESGETSPPSQAVNLFAEADAGDWHVHPSSHSFPFLSNDWTLHGECHYQGGLGVFLAEKPNGDPVLWTPPTGPFGSWSGTVAPDQCPTTLDGDQLPPLLVAHGKWWTLHAWVWFDNPEGVFHPTNPRVSG